jgi:hypothetical protein
MNLLNVRVQSLSQFTAIQLLMRGDSKQPRIFVTFLSSAGLFFVFSDGKVQFQFSSEPILPEP